MITPETASQALSSWLAYLQITQESDATAGVAESG